MGRKRNERRRGAMERDWARRAQYKPPTMGERIDAKRREEQELAQAIARKAGLL